MAKSDLLISLVRAGVTGDRPMMRSAVEAIVADERAKSHHALADRLERALQTIAVTPPSLVASQRSPQAAGRDTILEVTPRISLDELVLPLPARAEGMQLIEEHVRADVLRASGYEPRHRVLLSGPPGNGKTSFAEAIAEGLSLPFFVVRYDALVGSYLGETNARLRALFDYARTQPCVLFFDEFDAIGKERGDDHETGEIKRVVSFLLMQIDKLPSYVVTIAATNHAELLDRAVWRRFQIKIAFPAPQVAEIAHFIERIYMGWPERPSLSAFELAQKIDATSYAEVLDFCQNVRRRQILGLGEISIDSAVKTELEFWSSRVKPENLHGGRSNEASAATDARQSGGKTKRQAATDPQAG
ncbi:MULTISPECIES: AAA family ATPase [Bradyrhizobium]|uniref:AAA family ATPase n=4 Tax=Bradyrhizobium TaxID=374 RepID=A0AAE5X8N3_9BRAD|nr:MULTISPECIES: ATP-binding protein [Bradyrhizobium]MCG2628276.1 AAA family ATPase [Bradyrhizobium zhengyangense]MCG2643395.1 AAA family ATPase [Bradyrhizobium zhengyangense]MCG2670290.1 AAA family ATPase [Bradyrhizobium zhengyangense]MDN4985975.1 AAA family ATPase [Bradyrhizobium sp. WYCCWR 13022]MDN5002645.1 AAA family ATPase [Bradyrhizobium sp. WYCCWR 12677]